jgi:negative regulator of flagellin synthesis FlgM
MKVSNDKPVSVIDYLGRSSSTVTKEKPGIEKKQGKTVEDVIELSLNKKETEKIKDRIKELPIVRADKVEQVKEAIKTGTYNVKGEAIATSMLKNGILDEIL